MSDSFSSPAPGLTIETTTRFYSIEEALFPSYPAGINCDTMSSTTVALSPGLTTFLRNLKVTSIESSIETLISFVPILPPSDELRY